MRTLITGATGFVGRHLIAYLAAAHQDNQIHATTMGGDLPLDTEVFASHTLDLKDAGAVQSLIADVRPDHIYHLAAQASPQRSRKNPWETLENNIRAQLNIFQACLDLSLTPRILVVSSGEIYRASDRAIVEDAPFHPTSPYAVSKISQDMLALQYFISDGAAVMRARPFNHTGPGQAQGYVAADFAFQIARIETGQQEPVMRVGNLDAKRDFTDVRDVVRAYQLIAEHGEAGAAYNIAAGKAYSIQDLLNILLNLSSIDISVQKDPALFRPVDEAIKLGNYDRLHEATGWQPQISFEQTLSDLLDDCRHRLEV